MAVTYILPVTEAEVKYLVGMLYHDQKHPELDAKVIELNNKLVYQKNFSKVQA